MLRSVRAAVLLALSGLAPGVALAQSPAPQPSAPPSAPGTAAPATTGTDAPGAAPAASATAPTVPATGYGWSPGAKGHKQGKKRATAARTPSEGTVLPGFETMADGTSRLFVQLPRAVAYDTKAAKGSITYVLKGVRVDKRNNYNPLVTVDFNTPVTQARLVSHGKDSWFVVELRANVTPTVTMDATKDGGAMLKIAFAKGDYVASDTSGDDTAAAATPAPRRQRRGRNGGLPPEQLPPPDSAIAPAPTGAAPAAPATPAAPAGPAGPASETAPSQL